MPVHVVMSEDPGWVLAEAKEYLTSEPVLHNLVLTLLHERLERSETGRYWVAKEGGAIVGVGLQSPVGFPINLTPMKREIAAAMADAIASAGTALPGVNAEAATAAWFTGRWTERCKAGAVPVHGLRIYDCTEVQAIIPEGGPVQGPVRGQLRRAVTADRDLLVSWVQGFHADIGESGNSEAVVDQRLPAGRFWIWEDGDPVSMAAHSEAREGVVRIQIVYTPPERRSHGYAGACVGQLSKRILQSGSRCMLYTALSNPVSNSVFRQIGYRAVAEGLRYRFV